MEETIKILAVEDSTTQALQLQNLLEKHQYKVSLANNADEAFHLLRHEIPDIIISDIVMPGINGFEFCQSLKLDKNYKHIPVILLTSLSSYQDVIKSIESGANAFITKPYDKNSLLSRLDYIQKNKKIRETPFFEDSEDKIEVYFNEKKHRISSNHLQMIDLLISTFESAVQKNLVLEETTRNLMQSQQTLHQQNQELLKLNEQRNQFFGMACHDLRNPIGTIIAFSHFLLESDLSGFNSNQLDFLKRINASSNFMLGLLDELLDISKINAGKVDLNYKSVDLNALIQENIAVNQILATKKEIQLTFAKTEPFLIVELDPLRMEQVLNNLISNAIKYSHPKTTVKIQTTLNTENVLLFVKDEGQGIPPHELNKLFTPFGKTSVRGTHGEKSTGLGLAIVCKIIQEHHGKIWVESEHGKGSTFFIHLPTKKPF